MNFGKKGGRIETEASEIEHQFGEITILFELNQRFEVMGVAMNGMRKAPRKDLFAAIGFFDTILSAPTLSVMARKMIQDAKIPLQNTLASLPSYAP